MQTRKLYNCAKWSDTRSKDILKIVLWIFNTKKGERKICACAKEEKVKRNVKNWNLIRRGKKRQSREEWKIYKSKKCRTTIVGGSSDEKDRRTLEWSERVDWYDVRWNGKDGAKKYELGEFWNFSYHHEFEWKIGTHFYTRLSSVDFVVVVLIPSNQMNLVDSLLLPSIVIVHFDFIVNVIHVCDDLWKWKANKHQKKNIEIHACEKYSILSHVHGNEILQ